MALKKINLNMKKITSREDFHASINEDEIVNIDIKLDAEPDTVIRSVEAMDGVQDAKVLPFGVIKAKAMKKKIAEIKKLAGVEDVEIEDKVKKVTDKF
jgi:hypothetical protein